MVTSADLYVIKLVGYSILSILIKTVTRSFLYGVFVILFSATITIMMKRGLKSLPSIVVFSVTIINFILVSTSWACNMAVSVQAIRYDLIDQNVTTFNSKTLADFNWVGWRYSISQTALNQLMLTLSDSIVIWRAWVLVPRRWMMAFPILLVVGSTACGFAFTAILSSDFRWFIAYSHLRLSLVSVMSDASMALSFLANAFATVLIAHTLWLHWRSRKAFGLQMKPSKVLKVLAIIVDTGVAFLLLQGLNILTNFLSFEPYSAVDFFQTVISSAYTLIIGMYPTIVIYLVNQQRSLVEVFGLSRLGGSGTPDFNRTIPIGPLAFAHQDTMPVTDVSPTDDKDSIIRPVDSIAQDDTQEKV